MQAIASQRRFRRRADDFIHQNMYIIDSLASSEKRVLREKELTESKRKREEQHEREVAEAEETCRRKKKVSRERAKAGAQVITSLLLHTTAVSRKCLFVAHLVATPPPHLLPSQGMVERRIV